MSRCRSPRWAVFEAGSVVVIQDGDGLLDLLN